MEETEKIREHVAEVLRISGSKERYLGRVEQLDQAGSTAFIESGGQFFLAFTKPLNLKPGQSVSFRTDGQRAVDIVVEES